MKITLKNFRCYENSTFDFGNQGLVLVSGPSGAGKSSIMLGIYFALFGTGNKLNMYGKTSCSVILEFDDMIISRTKKPNRLVVNHIYEDDAAQSIIDKRFGESFKTTGYISQNSQNSFILMSPIEKLAFLEKFAFKDADISKLKKRCKDLIREREDTLNNSNTQVETAILMLEKLTKPKKVEFPLKCSKKNNQKAIDNEIIRHKNSIILVNRCKKKLNNLEDEVHAVQVLNAKLESKKESLDSITEKLSDIYLEESKINYIGDKKLSEYQNQLYTIISQRELISLLNSLQERYKDDIISLENMKKEEQSNKDKKIKDIEENHWLEYNKEVCISTMTEYKQIIKDIEKINSLKNELEKYVVDEDQLNNYIEDLKKFKADLIHKEKLLDKLNMQQEIFKCPSCSVHLKFQDNNLHLYESSDINEELGDIDVVSDDISKLKRKISSLDSSIPIKQNKLERYKEIYKYIKNIEDQYEDIPDLQESKSDLEYIKNYKLSQEELDRQLFDLKSNNGFSSTIISFERSLKQQAIKIDRLKTESKNITPDINEEVLRVNIITQKQNKEKLDSIQEDIKNLLKKKTIYENNIKVCTQEHIEKYSNVRTISEIKEQILNISNELLCLENKQKEYQLNVENIEKYKEYEKARDYYNSSYNKIDIFKKEKIESTKLYVAATLLRDKILEAESIAMMNVISSINTHTEGYLETFFPENPISVKLVPFKETKTGKKPQINLEIEYKGMEADINTLSGGELSRVILAYALALGEMFNTPMMLLDECTASLDQELTGVVMDGIRENFTGKLVITICHQVVKGQFDKVIMVGGEIE